MKFCVRAGSCGNGPFWARRSASPSGANFANALPGFVDWKGCAPLAPRESYSMELTDYLRILRKYWISVVALTLAGIAAAAGASMLMTPTYTASTSIFFTVQTTGTAGELNQGSAYAASQVKSYAQLATTPMVLDPVIERLELPATSDQLAQQVTASAPTSTSIVNLDVTGTDPSETAATSNAVAQQLILVVDQLSPRTPDGDKAVKATIVAPAAVPTQQTSPRVTLNLALGALVGLMIGLGQAVLRSRLDTRIRNERDVAEVTDRSVVGSIVHDPEAAQHPLIFQADPRGLRAEAYRRLRTNLQFLELSGRKRSIVVTSSIEDEGKTTTAINIASSLADAGQSVLLIDADLRRPAVDGYLNLDRSAGLTTVIIGRASLADVVQPLGHGNLHVLLSGQLPPNPSELLGSKPMQRLLDEATDRYDVVIVDSPPLLPVTDATVLSRICGGALVVVGSGTVRKPELASAIDSLEAVDANVLGLVLNGLKASDVGHYAYHHYYAKHDQGEQLEVDASVRRASRRAAPVSPVDVLRTEE